MTESYTTMNDKNQYGSLAEVSLKNIDKILSTYYPKSIPEVHQELKMDLLREVSPIVAIAFDFSTRSYLHVSENIFDMLGITSQQLISQGLALGTKMIEEKDRAIFNTEILLTIMNVYGKLVQSGKDVFSSKLTYNLKMINKEKELISTIHILKPITVNEEGFPQHIAKYIVHDVLGKSMPYPEIKMEVKNKEGKYEVLYTKSFMPKSAKNRVLSNREQQILGFIKEGYSSQEIADKLFISLHTVNNHRRSLVRKCGVKNLALAEMPS